MKILTITLFCTIWLSGCASTKLEQRLDAYIDRDNSRDYEQQRVIDSLKNQSVFERGF